MNELNHEQEFQNKESERRNERTANGWKCMALGASIGFIGCVLTMLDIIPEARDLWMYGLTTIGVIIAFLGCYLVLEQ